LNIYFTIISKKMKKFTTVLTYMLFSFFLSPAVLLAQTPEISIPQYGKQFTAVPEREDAAIYQVNMRTFSKAGNFKSIIARLDSIKALGINVVYLMPIYPIGEVKSVNSPYCIRDYKAVDPAYGTLEELRNLVDSAHHKNMAVILDWVANHTSFDHVWTKNKSWYLQDGAGNIISPPGTGWNDVAQLNYKNADMRAEMINCMEYWVLTANIDGFRCDYADGPPSDFWKEAISTLRKIPNHQLLFLAEGKHNDLYAAGFDYTFGFSFFENLEKIYKKNRSVKSIDTLNDTDYKGTSGGQQIVRYTTNHDVNGSDGTPIELFGGKKGSMAAFVIVAYMKSVPMVYNGQEVGTPYRLNFPFSGNKIDWTINPEVTAEYKKIIAFRNSSTAIRRGQLTSYSTADVCVFTKRAGKEKILVLANFRNKQFNYSIPSDLLNTAWKNALTGDTIQLKSKLSLAPYTYLVLKE